MKLVLFDIDGTLISSGGAGVRSLDHAFRDVLGIDGAFRDISMAGKTDFQIIREGLLRHSIHSGNGMIPLIARRYLRHLSHEIMNSPSRHLKPGVLAALERLRQQDDLYTTGLLTGNICEGARIKLAAFGLNDFFPFGAFGDDNEERDNLLPFALQRFAAFSGKAIVADDCVVIGDTPLDVRCARSHGARSIAVATGPYTMEALRKSGAGLVLPDLADTDGLMQHLA